MIKGDNRWDKGDPVSFLESRTILKKFAVATFGDLIAGAAEATQNLEILCRGKAKNLRVEISGTAAASKEARTFAKKRPGRA